VKPRRYEKELPEMSDLLIAEAMQEVREGEEDKAASLLLG
jgi:predicted DNA-binding protein